jgi:hypothetical protein
MYKSQLKANDVDKKLIADFERIKRDSERLKGSSKGKGEINGSFAFVIVQVRFQMLSEDGF